MALITLRFHFLSIAKVSGVGKFDFDSGTLALSGLSAGLPLSEGFLFSSFGFGFCSPGIGIMNSLHKGSASSSG